MNKEVEMNFFLIFLFTISLALASKTQNAAVREVAVIVTKEGYYPKYLTIFEGEKVKFYVTSTVENPDCLIVESHKIFMAANKGKVTEAEALFDKAGEYAFYCPSSKNDGKIVVLKKVAPKREVASEKNDSLLWTPKEY
jgi:plastocyanin